MPGADARQAKRSMARLMLLDCRRANLRHVDLTGSDFRLSDFGEADLGDATFADTVLGGTSLRGSKGLDSCRHLSPSTIDFRRLGRSGPLPPVFLRGCGLPDRIIASLPALLAA